MLSFAWLEVMVVLAVIFGLVCRYAPWGEDRKLYLGMLFIFGLLLYMAVTSVLDSTAYRRAEEGWFAITTMTRVWIVLVVPSVLVVIYALFKPKSMTMGRMTAYTFAFIAGILAMMWDLFVQLQMAG